jgi:hypothetical protein
MIFKCMDAVSTAADAYSEPISLNRDSTFSLQVEWTGTPTGVLKLEFSNKQNPASGVSSDWVTDTAYTFPANPAGGASNTFEQWSGAGSAWVRLWYDRTSGTGTMTAYAKIKDE